MRILVTGGSGFIGTRLIGDLLAKGHEVRILDKVRSSFYPAICQVGDIRNPDDLDTSLKGIDLVYHLAAEHRDDVSPPSLYYEVNVEGTGKLAQACTNNGVTRLIFTSSVAVYGLNAGEPTEESSPNPFNDYGKSKLQGEEILREWAHETESSSLVIVRPTVIFGEGNRGNVYNLMKQIASGSFIMIGDGFNKKSMGYVGNISSFLTFVGETSTLGFTLYNFADKPDMDMNELISIAKKQLKKTSRLNVRIPYWLGMAGGYCFDMLSFLSGKVFPVSSIRVSKFCASTVISVSRMEQTGFVAPYNIHDGIVKFLAHDIDPIKV